MVDHVVLDCGLCANRFERWAGEFRHNVFFPTNDSLVRCGPFPSRFVKLFIRCIAVLCLPVACLTARAGLLLYEPFNYPDGSLVVVATNIWATHSGTTGQVEVISGRVDLRVPSTEDVNTSLGQTFPANSSTVLYASFTLNYASVPTPSGTENVASASMSVATLLFRRETSAAGEMERAFAPPTQHKAQAA